MKLKVGEYAKTDGDADNDYGDGAGVGDAGFDDEASRNNDQNLCCC